MDQIKESESQTAQNECEWPSYTGSLNKLTEASDVNISTQDDVKVKVEIELKEEENGLVYQPDFYGHLRLVSMNQIVSDESSATKNKETDVRDWQYANHSLSTSEVSEDIIVPTEESSIIYDQNVYEHLNNVYEYSEEKAENVSSITDFQRSSLSPSEICSDLQDEFQQQFPESRQDGEYNQKKKELSHILAEKKRNYRNKIKEENPTMWCAMKQKEACKKREQREEKRFILLEMQRMMQLMSLPESPDTENHGLYLDSLKERFPDIWRQLVDALSAAEQRSNEILDGTNPTAKRRTMKPIRVYKDIVEAQKKYLYRQRLKLQRPDLYEQQKARDSYARSIRRMLKKQLSESQNNCNS